MSCIRVMVNKGSHFDTSPSSMKDYRILASGGHIGPMSREGSYLLWSNPKVRLFYDKKWY